MGRKAKHNPEPVGGHWLLPSISRTMGIFEMPNDIKGLVEWVRRESGDAALNIGLPVDPKTLRRGVRMSPTSVKRVFRYLLRAFRRSGFGRFPSLRALRSELPSDSRTPNTLYWRSFVASRQLTDPSDFPASTLAFIRQRCDLEDKLMAEVTTLKDQPNAATETLRQGLRVHSCIPEEHLGVAVDQLINMALEHHEDPKAEIRPSLELAHLMLWMWWDPLLQLAAVAETEWCSEDPGNRRCGPDSKSHGGLMGRFWPIWDGEELVLPIARFFDHLRRRASMHQGLTEPMSWHQLAEYLPDPVFSSRLFSSSKTGNTKYQQLRLWINGRRPTDARFDSFVRRLGGNDIDVLDAGFVLRLVYGLDDDVRRTIEETASWSISVKPVLGEIFARYPLYLQAQKAPGAPQGGPGAESQSIVSDHLSTPL